VQKLGVLDSDAYFPKEISEGCSSPEFAAKIEVFPDMMVIKTPAALRGKRGRYGGAKRGRIRGFSAASRLRLLRLICTIRPNENELFHFLTLTYSDDYAQNFELWKRDLDKFLDRLLYKFPAAWVIWRMEFQTRKSGKRIGELAPHFHILVGGINPAEIEQLPDFQYTKKDMEKSEDTLKIQRWAKENWFAVNHCEDKYNLMRGADVELLDSRKKAFLYVSKYAAKECDAVNDDGEILFAGRVWGKRGNLPIVQGMTITVTSEVLVELRRLIKRWLMSSKKKSSRRYAKRFARSSRWSQHTIFGLGSDRDMSGPAESPLLHKMLFAAMD
jgi:hypothetical protein